METTMLTISSVGQITIPRTIRKLLDLKAGDRLTLRVDKEKNAITLECPKSFDDIMAELDEIDEKYPSPAPDPRAKYMTVGEMSLEGIKDIEGNTWV